MTTRRTFSRATAGLLFLGVAVILCVAALVFRGIQKNSVPRRQFVEIKAKAEEGDARRKPISVTNTFLVKARPKIGRRP